MKIGDVIELNWREKTHAHSVGSSRRLNSQKRGDKDGRGIEDKSDAEQLFANIAGALGELVFAKGANFYWPASVNAVKEEPDILPDWQVRHAEKHNWRLIVRPDDPFKHRFVLITGPSSGPFIFRGWILGTDAQREEWWGDRGGRDEFCWWVPQQYLHELPNGNLP